MWLTNMIGNQGFNDGVRTGVFAFYMLPIQAVKIRQIQFSTHLLVNVKIAKPPGKVINQLK